MKIFREEKGQPIKFRGFKFIDFHKDFDNICYYYKELPRGNYEIMECMLEGERKPELGAGTTVKLLDPFMVEYLVHFTNKKKVKSTELVVTTIDNYFYDMEEDAKKSMLQKFGASVPKEISSTSLFQKYKDEGYTLLYCSNDETPERLFGIVNIVLVKKEHIKQEQLGIDRTYINFKPFRYTVSPAYLKGNKKQKYLETEFNEIRVDKDLLV